VAVEGADAVFQDGASRQRDELFRFGLAHAFAATCG
jgi:hypothetical protein